MINEERTFPIVSICCMAFNHAPFIRKCLDGFLMQEPPTGVSANEPWYEILIHDDASTDGTDEIIKEYAAKYPDKILPLYEEENQYSKGKVIDAYNYDRARGRYIAVCEGDDYWTDPYKLQKQVEFMDSHPDYSVCFHRVKHYNVYNNTFYDDFCGNLLKEKNEVDINMDVFFQNWVTQPLSELFRVSMFDKAYPHRYKYYRDMHEVYHLLQGGKGRLLSFYGGVRTIHKGGVTSMIDDEKKYKDAYDIAFEIYKRNHDKYAETYYANTLQWLINSNKYYTKREKMRMTFQLFFLTYKWKRFFKNTLRILKS